MSPGRNRKRESLEHDMFDDFGQDVFVWDTDNPEFELFDPELQAVFDARFQAGIDLTERNDLAQIRATKQASLDCAARFRASAAKRAAGTTFADAARIGIKRAQRGRR